MKLTLRFYAQQDNLPPIFKNELIIEREASLQIRPSLEALRREAQDLDAQIRQLQVDMTTGSNYIDGEKEDARTLQQLKSGSQKFQTKLCPTLFDFLIV